MAHPHWGRAESADVFPEDVLETEDLAVVTLSVDADSQDSADLLTDPLPMLAKNLDGVDADWSVSIARVNAEHPVGPRVGPRKLVLLMLLMYARKHIAAVAYRVPERGT